MLSWIKAWRFRREYRRIGDNFTTAEKLRREARSYDAKRCAELVEDLVSGDRHVSWLALQALTETGPQSVGPLIAALSDRRFIHPPRASGAEERHVLAGFNKPMPRVLRLLAKHQPLPPEAAAPLRRLCEIADADVRAEAAKLLAGMGVNLDVGTYRKHLAGADNKGVAQALRELTEAVRRGRGSETVVALFDNLTALLDSNRSDPTYDNHKSAAVLMLRVDLQRATGVLLRPGRLEPSYAAMPGILEALVESGASVPPALLLPLLEALWPRESRSWSIVKGAALRLAARTDDPACRAFIDRAMVASDAKLRKYATPAWAEVQGLPADVVEGRLYPHDDERLPMVVRRWSAAHFFARFTQNDGIAQPIGRADLVRLALAGMRAAGADDCAAVVENAAALLRQGASCDDPRVEQAGRDFWKLADELEVKLTRLAADHLGEFVQADGLARSDRKPE
jgi:hypothetical protein